MKSGGRGARYALNLCNLLEQTTGSRLTRDLFDRWCGRAREEAVQFSPASVLGALKLPEMTGPDELAIFGQPVSVLQKSQTYPYGLSLQKVEALITHGFQTVGDLAAATDEQLDDVPSVGEASILRIRNVLGQAIWM